MLSASYNIWQMEPDIRPETKKAGFSTFVYLSWLLSKALLKSKFKHYMHLKPYCMERLAAQN